MEKYSACERNAGRRKEGTNEGRKEGREEGRMYRYELDQIKLAEARIFETDAFRPRIRWCRH